MLAAGSLAGLVVELTEHDRFDDLGALRAEIDGLRDLGALVAIDDAGAGYAGLQTIVELSPDLVKLDRSLIAGIHEDEAKLALVETMGALLSRIDSWLLAEGIEEQAELDAIVRLGVPLGQGYVFGRPAPGWQRPDAALMARVSGRNRRTTTAEKVASVMEPAALVRGVTVLRDGATEDLGSWVVLVDRRNRPLAVAGPGEPRRVRRARDRDLLTVKAGERVTDVLDRALTRSSSHRFDPVVCTDPEGRAIGMARMERLIGQVVHEARSEV